MKSAKNKILIFALCAACIAGSASCSLSQTYPVTVDGEPLRAGIYRLEQSRALSSAQSKIREEQPDLDTSAEDFSYMKQTVEGISFSDWVNNETLANCRRYMAVERLFSENGLTLTDEELNTINSNVKSLWTEENAYAQYIFGVNIVGEYYESLGIGEQSYKDFNINSTKSTDLFDYLYGEDGPEAVTDEEKANYIKENYAAVNYFEYDLENGSGAQSYADRISKGESYEEVYADYQEDKQREDIQAEMDTAKENGEEYTGDSLDSVSVDAAETDSLLQVIKKDSTSPSEDFVKQVFEMASGDIKVISVTSGEGDDAQTTEYVVTKADISEHTDLTESYDDEIIHGIKDDIFEATLKEKGDSFTLTEDSSKNLYKIEEQL